MPPAWQRRLQDALSEHAADRSVGRCRTYVGYFALSTLSGHAPRVRHVVHRGFAPGTSTLLTTTDVRAPKAHEIHAHPAVELAWWIGPARLQFRIAGHASLVSGAGHAPHSGADAAYWRDARVRVWHALSPPLQATFQGPAPGSPRDDPCRPDHDGSGIPTRWVYGTLISSFALVLIEPRTVDVLDLGQMQRTIYTQEGTQWRETHVTP